MANQRNPQLMLLVESAIMLALSIALSFIVIWEMPMGGNVTLLSMLPLCLLSAKYGIAKALPASFLYSLFQLAMGFFKGNVFTGIKDASVIAVIILFDYIVPFTNLGLAGMFKKIKPAKFPEFGILLGIVLVIFIRFVCHYLTGITVWRQYAPEGQSKFIYSLLYNGQYMLPELIMTSVAAGILVKVPAIKKIIET